MGTWMEIQISIYTSTHAICNTSSLLKFILFADDTTYSGQEVT